MGELRWKSKVKTVRNEGLSRKKQRISQISRRIAPYQFKLRRTNDHPVIPA